MSIQNPNVPAASVVTDAMSGEFVRTIKRIVPLWRVGVVGLAALTLVVMHLGVRMVATQVTSDIRTYTARGREAATARDQLRLEMAIREGNDHLQRAALAYGLTAPTRVEVVRLEGEAP